MNALLPTVLRDIIYVNSQLQSQGQFNLTASLPVTQQITAFIEARNLGNRRYEPANGFVIPGRSAILGMRGIF